MRPLPPLLVLVLAASWTAPLAAAPREGLSLSGASVSSLDAALLPDYGAGASLGWGAEEYAALRLRARTGEGGSFVAALNLVAASGSAASGARGLDPARGLLVSPFVVGEGYASALELERLYLRVEGGAFDAEAGLLRLPFGFGQAFSPSDFLLERNPLLPDARPRGRLALCLTAYPSEASLAKAFAATPEDALATGTGSFLYGLSAELHGRYGSAQLLYAYETPGAARSRGLHRGGLSLKLESYFGLVLDALYSLDPRVLDSGAWFGKGWAWWRGLEAALGIDYSLADGDLILLGQYLWNGPGLLDPETGLDALYPGLGASWREGGPATRLPFRAPGFARLNRRDYLLVQALWRLDDYTRASLSATAGLDDLSLIAALRLEHEAFQGLLLSLEGRLPLDRAVLGQGDAVGELGPLHTGYQASLRAAARLSF